MVSYMLVFRESDPSYDDGDDHDCNQPSKYTGSDLGAFCLRPVTASVQPESGRVVYAKFP